MVPRPPALQTPAKPKPKQMINNTKPSSLVKPKKRTEVPALKKPPQEVKKIVAPKLPETDKRFTKMIGSSVACRLAGNKDLVNGNLRWVGHLPQLPLDNAHLIAGVELLTDNKLGTDGTYRGVRYFKSSPKRGYFFKLKDCKAVKH